MFKIKFILINIIKEKETFLIVYGKVELNIEFNKKKKKMIMKQERFLQ